MNILFELSKEHKTLPRSEVKSCLKSENISYNIVESNEDAFIVDADITNYKIRKLAERLAMTFFIDKVLFISSTKKDILKQKEKISPLKEEGSVAITYKNRSENINSKKIIAQIAEIYTQNKKVDLRNPDNEIRVLITDKKIYVGLKKAQVNRTLFEKRKVQHRPFFSPISLHPKIAKTLVNLSEIRKNETLLDPFCGTGGILIEAGIIGARLIGSDIEKKMIDGCKKTLDFYGIKNYKLFCCDIGEIKKHVDFVDAVVTDLPYGKSTTTKGEEIINLYERAFENISKVLKEKRKAVIGLSNKKRISIGEKYLSLVEKHEFRVHKSLTRYFVVYQK
ncbi:MAG: TRM11 family methyltransferase [Candidatus Thermoplasmatota archaeon]|jgi:tRNA (guanine10-N2)-dimethyltransferase|nr:TRM11 family methyltransferase [Candidatus Thermoplasmatota archaeon]